MHNFIRLCLASAMFLIAACGVSGDAANTSATVMIDRASDLARLKDSVVPFFKPMHVQVGDWIKTHPENGQTFAEYLESDPTLPTAERKTIVIQPIGNFTPGQKRVMQFVADYMKSFYGLPVRLEREKALGQIPKESMRIQYPKNRQIRTTYFIDEILPGMLPNDAMAFICFTSSDLYPEDTWNYVFGQASLKQRVGVWSLYRLGEPDKNGTDFNLLLDRTLKIGMHEMGHLFSMQHCTKYECLMSGSNSLEETDRRPLDVCPECMTKIAWAINYDPADRYRNLAAFWQKQGRTKEQMEMLAKAKAVDVAAKK